MANKKSSKKSIKQIEKRTAINRARSSDVKTAMKKVVDAVRDTASLDSIQRLFRDATSRADRAARKGVFKKQTISRKLSRLAKKINNYFQSKVK